MELWTSPADRFVRSGTSLRARELGAALGIGERQARRHLQRLRRAGLVELQNTGRGYRIRLTEDEVGPNAVILAIPREGIGCRTKPGMTSSE